MTTRATPDLTLDTTWQQDANCRGIDPDLFFPGRGEDSAAPKAVCQGCTVRTDCLEHALAQHEIHGIWGGMSERERRNLRRFRNLARYGHVPLGRIPVRDGSAFTMKSLP